VCSSISVLSSPEAAKRLGIRPGTLRLWRMTGQGPAYVRYSGPRGRAVYLESAIAEFLQGRSHTSTSEEAALIESGR
jgi:hypothetical protein